MPGVSPLPGMRWRGAPRGLPWWTQSVQLRVSLFQVRVERPFFVSAMTERVWIVSHCRKPVERECLRMPVAGRCCERSLETTLASVRRKTLPPRTWAKADVASTRATEAMRATRVRTRRERRSWIEERIIGKSSWVFRPGAIAFRSREGSSRRSFAGPRSDQGTVNSPAIV
jgi:hypothetical protein